MPAKVTMNLAEFGLNAWNTAMPAYIESLGASGFKWVGGFSENRREHDLPFLIAMILVQDAQTGYPLGLLDGVHITNLRTGAVTALAVQKYAPPGARSLAQIGTGTQARFGVAAIRNIVDLEVIFGPSISIRMLRPPSLGRSPKPMGSPFVFARTRNRRFEGPRW